MAWCIRTARVERIENGLAWGRKINVTGTPTVLINGWRFVGSMSVDSLSHIIDRVALGKPPLTSMDRASGR
jgi:protein-disulfide isomerase